MKAIDGSVSIRARGAGAWPDKAICDLGVVSSKGPRAAVYLTQEQVLLLISRLLEQVLSSTASEES